MWGFDDYYANYLELCEARKVVPYSRAYMAQNVPIGADPKDAFAFFDHLNKGTPARVPSKDAGAIESTLAERGARYGSFKDHAAIAQDLQDDMRAAPGWNKLAPDQKQALSVIADKIARMLNGDPDYLDNWHDIIGYAKLVEDRLKLEQAV